MAIRTQIIKKDRRGREEDQETQVRIIDQWAKEHRDCTLVVMLHTAREYMIFVYEDGKPAPDKGEVFHAEGPLRGGPRLTESTNQTSSLSPL